MRKFVGAIFGLSTTLLSIAVGVATFIFGVVMIIDGAKADPTNAWLITKGFGAIFLATIEALIVFYSGLFLSAVIGGSYKPKRRNNRGNLSAKQVENQFRKMMEAEF